MRLIHAPSRTLKNFVGDNIPPYVILSHTWAEDEVTLQDMAVESRRINMAGYKKIDLCCNQALEDAFEYAWVDTCCIDKTSSAELSEAINSMFKWYQNSELCYVYLSDVSAGTTALEDCRYFTRGWTLQELIAPQHVEFFDKSWHKIGNKSQLAGSLSSITGVPGDILISGDDSSLSRYSVAEKLSWAARRKTTRAEDRAYSLLGLLNVNMPLLYGEGNKAFERLQRKVIKSTSDPTIFAWSRQGTGSCSENLCGLLAESPDDFGFLSNVVPNKLTDHSRSPPTVRSDSITIILPCQHPWGGRSDVERGSGSFLARLDCESQTRPLYIRLCYVRSWDGGRLRRSEHISMGNKSPTMPPAQHVFKEQPLSVFSDKIQVSYMPGDFASLEPRVLNPGLVTRLPLLAFFTKSELVHQKLSFRIRYMSGPRTGRESAVVDNKNWKYLSYTMSQVSSDTKHPQDQAGTSGTASPLHVDTAEFPLRFGQTPNVLFGPHYDSIEAPAGAHQALCILEIYQGLTTIAEMVIGLKICRPRPKLHIACTNKSGARRRRVSDTSRVFYSYLPNLSVSDYCERSVHAMKGPLNLSANIRKWGGLSGESARDVYKVEINLKYDQVQ